MAECADLGKTLEMFRLVQERKTRLAALDASISRGIANADAGRVRPISDAFDGLESKLKAKAARR
jgi:antitoxin ParD1/3/4